MKLRQITYAAVGDDILPDLMLGRISVNTVAEAQAHIDKIIAYEANPPDGDWKHRILAVTDKRKLPIILTCLMQFEQILSLRAISCRKGLLGLGLYRLKPSEEAIKNELNNGVFLVNYIGHGAYTY